MLKIPENLFSNGFEDVQLSEKINTKNLKKITEFIELNFKKTQKINKKFHSYNMKHIVENSIGEYISNGSFIAAMIKSGYSFERCRGSLNCWFNALAKRS